MVEQIIGIDCATDPKKVGVSIARWTGSVFRLGTCVACSRAVPPEELVARAIGEVPSQTLLALDAPLGWPAPLGDALVAHRAGQPLRSSANEMFRRHTDREMSRRFQKTPLDVGADRIARTAHWALNLLAAVRSRLNEPIPLAWNPSFVDRVAAIEVYPAATLLAHGVVIKGYKATSGATQRASIHAALMNYFELPTDLQPVSWSIDALDASVCALAGLDFVSGRSEPPGEPGVSAKEGWIWVRAQPNREPNAD